MVELDVESAKWEAQSGGLMRVQPAGRQVPPVLRSAIAGSYFCRGVPCVVTFVDDRRVVVVGSAGKGLHLQSSHFALDDAGLWQQNYDLQQTGKAQPLTTTDVATARVELRTVERRQLFVDDKPIGDAFP